MARGAVKKKRKWTKECGKTKQKKREKLKGGFCFLREVHRKLKKKRKRKGKGKCGLPLEGFRGANRAPHFLVSFEKVAKGDKFDKSDFIILLYILVWID